MFNSLIFRSVLLIFPVGMVLLGTSANMARTKRRTPCACTMEYRPICGSDSITYPTLCTLECAILKNPGLLAACSGPCPCNATNGNNETSKSRTAFSNFSSTQNRTSELEACMCPKMSKIISQVCGSNNVTYSNECMLQCAQRNNTDLVKMHNGECTTKQE